MRPSFKNRLLLLGSIGLSLLFAEGLVRLFFPQTLFGPKFEILSDGSKVNRSHGTTTDEMFGRTVQYNFKPFHLRETPRSPQAYEVLVLGDSYTLGWLLHPHETFLAKLQRQANQVFGVGKFHFLNAGTGGWGTADQMVFLENLGDKIQPDAVLVFYNNNDISRSLVSPLVSFDAKQNPPLARKRTAVVWYKRFFAGDEWYNAAITYSHLLRLVRNVFLQRVISVPELERQDQAAAQRGVQLGQALFTRMKAWADARNLPLWVCTTGWFGDAPNPSDANQAFREVAPAFFRQHSIPFADFSRYVWLKRRSDLTAWEVPDGHPNPKGAELISKAAWPFVYSQLSTVSAGYKQDLQQGTESRSTRKLAPIP